MNKKILLSALISFVGFSTANAIDKIVFEMQDGTSISFCLEDEPKITFDETCIDVATVDNLYHIPLESFLWIRFNTDINAGIKETSLITEFSSDIIIVNNVNPAIKISLYNMEGKVFPIKVIQEGSSKIISISELEKGNYVLCVGQNKFKFVKK